VTIESNSAQTVVLLVTPATVGYLPVKIKAVCDLAGDIINQLLLVEPEGMPVYVNKAVLLDLRSDNSKVVDFTIDTPSIAVPDSTSTTVAVFGDLLGNTIQNLESLIRVPYGNAEQNMVAFIPNLLVLKYLKGVNKLTPNLESRLIQNLELGYTRQLNYRNEYNAFSFGGLYGNSDCWLTAFVLRYFAEASAYISIDQYMLNSTRNWLIQNQKSDGSFVENGQYLRNQFKNTGDVGTTAYALLALLSMPKFAEEYPGVVKLATEFIVERTVSGHDFYGMAISAYALQKAGHPFAKELLDRLDRQQKQDNGLHYWQYRERRDPTNKGRWNSEESINVELTAIILATYVESGRITDGFPVMNWLIKQRSSRGGYSGSQDTILGIQALALMAEKLYAKNTNIDVEITYGTQDKYNLKIDESNMNVVQNYELPLNTETIQFDFKGNGLAVAQVAYKYYVLGPEPDPRFNLNVIINNSSTTDKLYLSICTSFIPDNITKTSNMPFLEIGLPSGYVFGSDHVNNLRNRYVQFVQRLETANSDTVLMFYIYGVGTSDVCMDVEAVKVIDIAYLKPATVRIFDYYNNGESVLMKFRNDIF
jgi:CD109 antigen